MQIRRSLEVILREFEEGNETGEVSVIQKICDESNLKHFSYVAVSPLAAQNSKPHILHNYSPEWERCYWENNFLEIDPVLKLGFKSLMPLDWRSVRQISATNNDFFNQANELGVGNVGITIPIRGPNGDKGILSFSTHEKESYWDMYLKENLPHINLIAYHLHRIVQQTNMPSMADIKMGRRELEVLQWLARGKSKQDVADILGISVHTVKTYTESARFRLNALNTTHAVSKAISLSLIHPTHWSY